ncbi:MAG: hypothetical protein ABIS01_02055 [Ferruginibacter sp.]
MTIAAKYRPYNTYEDYCQWEGNWELIEGMPYAICPAPVPSHQRVSVVLARRFDEPLINVRIVQFTHRLTGRFRRIPLFSRIF